MKRLRIVVATLLACASLLMTQANPVLTGQARIELGTDRGADSVRLALPIFPLQGSTSGAPPEAGRLANLFNETLWNDLEFSGIISLVGRSFYPVGDFGTTGSIVPDRWTDPSIDAQVIAFGHAEIDPNGRFFVEAHLWDLKTVATDRELMGTVGLGFRIELSEPGVRLLAHKIADRIVADLGGGTRGIAQTKMAFVSDRNSRNEGYPHKEVFVMDYDGYNQYQVTTLRSTAITPRWSPDGRRLAYTHMSDEGVNIAIISPLDRQGFPFPIFNGTTTTPAWSPDGTKIAFSSSHGELRGQSDPELYVADANGDNVRRVTVSSGIDISPVWNPRTGREIAFVSDRSGTPQIYTMDAEGGNLQRIVDQGGHADEPSWSPDGLMIAYTWQPRGGGNSDIFIHDLRTRRNIQLTQNAGFNERPSWSPDGRHLVFQSSRNGTMQVYSMLANGSRVRQLTTQGSNESPAWSNYMAQ